MSSGNHDAPSLHRLLGVLLEQASPDPDFVAHILAAQQHLEVPNLEVPTNAETARPFLSVVMRTQGRRLEALNDALLCLAAQSDRDFEVIVVMHDASDEARSLTSATVEDHRPLLPHIEIAQASGGTRARPLNIGVEKAHGHYLAFFDDDDLLFAHWVETFRAGADSSPGRLLHSVSGTQRVSPERWADGSDGFRTLTWSMAEYAIEFDPLRNFVANHSPFMSIAFPATLFHTIGFRFDENLEVCEDWEAIARGASLLGMASVPELTSIYRRWEGGASSYTEHSGEAWAASERYLLARLDAEPTLLPAGSVMRLRSLIKDENAAVALHNVLASRSWRMLGPVRTLGSRARALSARARARMFRRRSN